MLSHLPNVTQQKEPGLDHGPDSSHFPPSSDVPGRKVARRAAYLIRQGTETQEPVLSLLQGGRELAAAKFQGQGHLGDLAQVTGAQLV